MIHSHRISEALTKLLYLDCETGGLDPKQNPAIQISGIIEIEGKVVREFDFRIRPPAPTPSFPSLISLEALKVNGIQAESLYDPDRLEEKDAYKKLKSIFLTYIDRYNKADKLYLMGQNVHFDYGFLLEIWKRQGDDYLGSFIHYHKIDLIALTASLRMAGVKPFGGLTNLKLATIVQVFGMAEQTHDALSDIRQTRDVYQKILEWLGGVVIQLDVPKPPLPV